MGYLRQTIFAPVLATVLMLGFAGAAQAACYGAGQELPAKEVSQFVNDPGQLLAQFPNGGPQMIPLVRDLVASDPGSLPLVINLDAKANADQIQAIGAGLGQAALVCGRTAQSFATEILRMTVTSNNQQLAQAFSAVMGELFLGSIGPPGVGGGEWAATSRGFGGPAVNGAALNLGASRPTGSTDTRTSGEFPSAPPGDPGNLLTLGTPGGGGALSGSVSPWKP